MKATLLLVILLSYFGDTAAQCINLGDNSINGETYENAPTGTVVATLNFTGDPDEIVLYFDEDDEGNAPTYFEIIGNEIKVKNSTSLSRSQLGGPYNEDSISITGQTKCSHPSGANSNVRYATTINMIYKNDIPPKAAGPYSVEQTEYVAIGTEIFTVVADDGDNTGHDVTTKLASQTPEGYFEIDGKGRVTLKRDLDYSEYTKHTLDVTLTDTGFSNDGNVMTISANQEFVINILDYDNLPPEFQLDGETFYSATVYTNKEVSPDPLPIDIEPRSIKAVDGDTADKPVIYSFEGGTNNYDRYFEIDRNTGNVTLVKPVENTTTFAITVKAAQEDRPLDRFSTTYLQIIASAEDENKPVFDSTSYNGTLLDDGSDIIFVENADTGGLLQLIATDDDSDALVIYSIDPPDSPFQISSQGYVFLQSTTTRASTDLSFTVTAINVNADQTSVNRKSDPVAVVVAIIEVTTQPTTEQPTTEQPTTEQPTTEQPTTEQPTTEPATTEVTTIAETTEQPTTEPTTFVDTTTYLDTTIEPTTEADTTTIAETTMLPTTDQTTIPDTTTVAETTMPPTTDQTTVPDTTTLEESTTQQPTEQTTLTETSTVEDTTIYTSPEQTTLEETTTVEDTTIITTPEQTTFIEETTTVEDTTVYTSPEQTTIEDTTTSFTTEQTAIASTTQDISTPAPTSTALDTTIVTNVATTQADASTAQSTANSVSSSFSTQPTTQSTYFTSRPEATTGDNAASTGATTGKTATTAGVITDRSTAPITSASTDSTSTTRSTTPQPSSSESTSGAIITSSTPTSQSESSPTSGGTMGSSSSTQNPSATTESPSAVETSSPSEGDPTNPTYGETSPATDHTSNTTLTSSSPAFTTSKVSTQGPGQVSTTGPIVAAVDMVPASTLYAVAASLSVVLFLAILVIVYLIWRLMKINKEDKEPLVSEDDDEESQTSSTVHQNGAYVEENETNSKGGYEEINVGFTSAAGAVLVTDLDADLDTSDDHLERQQDAGSIHSAPFEPDTETHEYQPENDGYEDIDDPVDIQHDDEMENEDGGQPISPFEDELQRRAAEIAVAAAATAMIAKSVEASPDVAVSALPRSLELPPEVVQEEKTIRDDYISTEKIVTLKGYGDDGQDVKAVMKSIDIDMAPSNEVDDVRKQITILEQLSEMDHPNILKYYGSYEKDGCLHFACKYAQNGSLQDKLRSGEMTDANTLMGIMADVGKGLQYLHAKNITHGNLWSKAIMLDADNNPMLTDIKGDGAVISDFSDVMRWQALEVSDQTSGCTQASDVWSYGTLMWEIISQGAVPYADVPLLDLADTIREQQLPKPEACSESLFSIMTTCWNHDPKRRPDMYVINSNLSEKLLEDSNDHIRLELTNHVPAMQDENREYFDDVSPPPNHDNDVDSDDADYTAF